MHVILFTDVADTLGYGKYAGTYKIATEIRKHGYTCQVIDLFSFYTVDQLEKIIKKFVTKDTLLVGFSSSLMEKRINGKVLNFGRPDHEFTDFLKLIKDLNNKVKICIGGARITINSYWEGVDYIVVNKGDTAIIALLDHIKNGTNLKIVQESPCIVINGNDYPYSQHEFSFSQINYIKEDIIFPGEVLPVEIARGCIFKCAFCHFDLIGKKIGDWQKNEEILRDELIRNNEMFGTTHFMFTDELINESLPKMRSIHKVLTSLPFKASYTSFARLDLIWRFPEMRELLLESGAISLAFGIETLHDQAGKKIGKALGSKKTKDTLIYCAELWKGKIITSSNFIIGLPEEPKESILETLEYLVSDECPLDIFSFLPLYLRAEDDGRGSASTIDKDPKKFGYEIKVDNQWSNKHLSFKEARELVQQIWKDPRVISKSKINASTWIGRILNLGYSIEEFFDILNSDINKTTLTPILTEKTLNAKMRYYEELMKL